MTEEILELKFDGGDIDPSKVKPSEIAALIENFEKALLATIKENNPEIDTESLLFSFDSIEHNSIDLRFKPVAAKESVIRSYELISRSIENNDFRKLPTKAVQSLKVISNFSKRHKCNGYFNRNNKTLSTFSPNTEITLDKSSIVKSATTIYGQIFDVGGENPNVHIKVSGDYTLIFDTTEEYAKVLASKLYETVGLKGKAKWDTVTNQIIDFELFEILDYSPGNVYNAIKKLRGITSGFWDKFNSNDDINKQLLRD